MYNAKWQNKSYFLAVCLQTAYDTILSMLLLYQVGGWGGGGNFRQLITTARAKLPHGVNLSSSLVLYAYNTVILKATVTIFWMHYFFEWVLLTNLFMYNTDQFHCVSFLQCLIKICFYFSCLTGWRGGRRLRVSTLDQQLTQLPRVCIINRCWLCVRSETLLKALLHAARATSKS